MKKKNQFLFSLLMAIVMMAMSPMKMWAETVTIYVESDGPTVIRQCSLNAGDELDVRVDYFPITLSNLGCTSKNYNYNSESGGGNYRINESGEYMIIISNPTVNNYETDVYSANVELHKITCISADANTDCSHIGQIDHWKCSSCFEMWNMALEQIQSATGYGNHKFVNGKCSVCSIVTPTLTEAQPDTYSWTTSDKKGYMPGLMSTNKGQDNSTSESTYSFSVTKAGRLMFDWAVSSEDNCDKLTITLDGSVVVDKVSGTAKGNIDQMINSGDHTLILSYSKDSSADRYDDRGYLYNLLFCDHSDNTNAVVHTPATCTTGSHDAHTCSVCGFQHDSNAQDDLLAHSYVNGKCVNGCGAMPSEITEGSFVDGTAYERTTAGTVATFTYKRTFYDNDFNCLYVPFKADVTAFTDCDIYTINMFQEHDTNGDGVLNELTLEVNKVVSGKILPNHPYLIKYKGELTAEEKTSGKEFSIEMSNILLSEAKTDDFTCSSMSTNYTFKGTYSAIDDATATAGNYYTLTVQNGETVLGKTSNGLKPQRWYMTMSSRDAQIEAPSANNAPRRIRIVVTGEDETTGIADVDDNANWNNGKRFENGRLVILKNGKKYNMNGQVIK